MAYTNLHSRWKDWRGKMKDGDDDGDGDGTPSNSPKETYSNVTLNSKRLKTYGKRHEHGDERPAHDWHTGLDYHGDIDQVSDHVSDPWMTCCRQEQLQGWVNSGSRKVHQITVQGNLQWTRILGIRTVWNIIFVKKRIAIAYGTYIYVVHSERISLVSSLHLFRTPKPDPSAYTILKGPDQIISSHYS